MHTTNPFLAMAYANGELQDRSNGGQRYRAPDEVLRDARERNSRYKAFVTSSAKVGRRAISMSKVQFGDGDFAYDVQELQRFHEPAPKPEPLPEIEEPVQVTRTLSRTLSMAIRASRSTAQVSLTAAAHDNSTDSGFQNLQAQPMLPQPPVDARENLEATSSQPGGRPRFRGVLTSLLSGSASVPGPDRESEPGSGIWEYRKPGAAVATNGTGGRRDSSRRASSHRGSESQFMLPQRSSTQSFTSAVSPGRQQLGGSNSGIWDRWSGRSFRAGRDLQVAADGVSPTYDSEESPGGGPNLPETEVLGDPNWVPGAGPGHGRGGGGGGGVGAATGTTAQARPVLRTFSVRSIQSRRSLAVEAPLSGAPTDISQGGQAELSPTPPSRPPGRLAATQGHAALAQPHSTPCESSHSAHHTGDRSDGAELVSPTSGAVSSVPPSPVAAARATYRELMDSVPEPHPPAGGSDGTCLASPFATTACGREATDSQGGSAYSQCGVGVGVSVGVSVSGAPTAGGCTVAFKVAPPRRPAEVSSEQSARNAVLAGWSSRRRYSARNLRSTLTGGPWLGTESQLPSPQAVTAHQHQQQQQQQQQQQHQQHQQQQQQVPTPPAGFCRAMLGRGLSGGLTPTRHSVDEARLQTGSNDGSRLGLLCGSPGGGGGFLDSRIGRAMEELALREAGLAPASPDGASRPASPAAAAVAGGLGSGAAVGGRQIRAVSGGVFPVIP